jgi:hypothetical protein
MMSHTTDIRTETHQQRREPAREILAVHAVDRRVLRQNMPKMAEEAENSEVALDGMRDSNARFNNKLFGQEGQDNLDGKQALGVIGGLESCDW